MDPCPGGKHVFQRVFMDHALKKMAALTGWWPVLGWRCRDGATVWRGGVDAAPCCQTGDQPRLPIDVPGEPEHAGGAERQRVKGAACQKGVREPVAKCGGGRQRA